MPTKFWPSCPYVVMSYAIVSSSHSGTPPEIDASAFSSNRGWPVFGVVALAVAASVASAPSAESHTRNSYSVSGRSRNRSSDAAYASSSASSATAADHSGLSRSARFACAGAYSTATEYGASDDAASRSATLTVAVSTMRADGSSFTRAVSLLELAAAPPTAAASALALAPGALPPRAIAPDRAITSTASASAVPTAAPAARGRLIPLRGDMLRYANTIGSDLQRTARARFV